MSVGGKPIDSRPYKPQTKLANDGVGRAAAPSKINAHSAQEQMLTASDAQVLALRDASLARPRSASKASRFVPAAIRAAPSQEVQVESVDPERLGDVDYIREVTKSGNKGKLNRTMRGYNDALRFRAAYAALGNKDVGHDMSVPGQDDERLLLVRRVAEAMMYVEDPSDSKRAVPLSKKRKRSPNGESATGAKKRKSDTSSVPSRAIEAPGPSLAQKQCGEDDNKEKFELNTWIKQRSPLLFEEKAWQLIYDAEAAQRGQYDIPDYNLLAGSSFGGCSSAFDRPIKYESYTDRMEDLISKLRVRKDLVMWLFQTPFSKHLAANPTTSEWYV